MSESEDDPFHDSLRNLETGLGIPSGFIDQLRDEDDWSFVIKTHALLEAAVSQALTHSLERPVLMNSFSKMNMSRKLDFTKALDLLDSSSINFIRKLSEIRNTVVHDVSNVNFCFDDFFRQIDAEGKLEPWQKALDQFFYPYPDIPMHGANPLTAKHVFLSRPKLVIAGGLRYILFVLHNAIEAGKSATRRRQEHAKLVREELLRQLRIRQT